MVIFQNNSPIEKKWILLYFGLSLLSAVVDASLTLAKAREAHTVVDSKELENSYYANVRGETGHIPRRVASTSSTPTRASLLALPYNDDISGARNQKSYRYYGTGSKSSNSFTPTAVHKSSSSNNYFITTKARENLHGVKDMDAAGSGNSGGADGNQYLTVYDTPTQHSSHADSGNNMMMTMEEAFGDMAAESGHGGGYGGGYGGHGHGGKGCNSALGLLGVLGLAAYLQNVLMNMNQTAGRRRRRDVSDDIMDVDLAKLENVKNGMAHLGLDILPLNETREIFELDEKTYSRVMRDVFPLLSAVSHARDGLIPIHCTHCSVCLANRVLVRDLGSLGHSIGIRISSAISKLLSRITKDERAEQIRMISKAGKMGRNGRNCTKVFPTCNRLKKLPTYNIPSVFYS